MNSLKILKKLSLFQIKELKHKIIDKHNSIEILNTKLKNLYYYLKFSKYIKNYNHFYSKLKLKYIFI